MSFELNCSIAPGCGRTGLSGRTLNLSQTRLLQLANRLFVSILIRSGIDLKEQVASVDNVAFLKRNIHNVTADPRRYVHELDRCGSAGELVPIYYLFLLRFAHRDFRGWWALRNHLLVVAAHEPKTQRDNG
jgi:hypothetical protein